MNTSGFDQRMEYQRLVETSQQDLFDGNHRTGTASGARHTVPSTSTRAREAPQATTKQEELPEGVTLDDFYAYMPMHSYLFIPTGDLWPASSVNGRIGILGDVKASAWLDANRSVEQMTWAPGEPELLEDRLIADGGWIERLGCRCFNRYRPPLVLPGDAGSAGPWLEHVHRVYPDSAEHILDILAHRVQRPGEKINHALVLGGAQGIGKDTLLEPVKHAIGPWNFVEITSAHLLGRFNGFTKSVILRISEARDLGDLDRFAFYEHLKLYTASPPDVLLCDEKNIREYAVQNVCGVVITTNHKTDGIYLPPDDRRHYVAWSDLAATAFPSTYWQTLYAWYTETRCGHVAAYLAERDISGFDPKAPPPKTPAFHDIVDTNRAPEDAELADALDAVGNPPAITRATIAAQSSPSFREWLQDRRNSRQVPHRMESAGYARVPNPDASDGRWKIAQKRQTVYARTDLTARDRLIAAKSLVEEAR